MVERYVSMRRISREKRTNKLNISFSKTELKDLLKAWVIISLAFSFLLSQFSSLMAVASMFIVSSLTVGIGFLFHEMAHKIVAQKYGCWAEFRASNSMLLLSLVMSLFGFLIAAPGAVLINGIVDRKSNGKISLAGPLTNIILALAFLALSFIVPLSMSSLAGYGFKINVWLALFNLIPFGIFDGAKIIAWDNKIWAVCLIITLALLMVSV